MNVLAKYSHDDDSFEEEVIDLSHYWRVLTRFKYSILLLIVIAAVWSAKVMKEADDTFDASASLLIGDPGSNITSIEDLFSTETQTDAYLGTQVELLQNRNLAERVIIALNLTQNPEFLPDPPKEPGIISGITQSITGFFKDFISTGATPTTTVTGSAGNQEQRLLASVVRRFGNRLSVDPILNTDLVSITFEAKDPQLAADLSNSLAEAYIQNDLEQRLNAAQQASSWLAERLQILGQTLDASKESLQSYLERERLVNIEGVTSLNIQELNQLTSQTVDARRNRAEAETIYRLVEQMQNPTVAQLLTIPAILNHNSIRGVRDNVSNVDQQIAELSNRYGRNHPRMVSLVAERATAQQALSRQAQQVVASLRTDFESAVSNERLTVSRLDQGKLDLQGVNRKGFQLAELEREVETNQQLYDMFFTRIRETDETMDFQSSNASIVELAIPPVNPSGPQRTLTIIIAMVAGMVLGILQAFVRSMLDNTLKNYDDIEDRLHAPVLGIMPKVKIPGAGKDSEMAYLGFMDTSQPRFAEAMRTIRTNITLSSLERPYKIIEVTSALPNEGKSTVAINLAAVLGQMGKVLLIDTDMRRPSLAKSIGLPVRTPGLSDCLARTVKVKGCIHRFKKAGISVMPAGQVVPNPLELLASPRFKKLLIGLSAHFDHIILDTPPSKAVSDSLVLATVSQATIYVVKANGTSARVVKSELERFKKARANVIGVILNQVDVSKKTDSYGGYYDSEGYGVQDLEHA